MAVLPVLAASFIMKAVAVIFFICAVALILIILIQKGRGGGMGAAFGGGLAGGLLGSKTGDFLTWVTIVLVSIVLILAVVMAKFYKPAVSDFGGAAPQRTALPAEQRQSSEQALPIDNRGDISGESTDANLLGG